MTSTRLSAFLDGVLEAGWLAAIVVTPLFFNIYSSRVFEPDKLTTLRSIALVMAAVWLVRLVEEWASGQRITRLTWRTPLLLPTLATVLIYLVSTAFSVTPYTSFFGSYQRLQGTFTMLSYITVFLIILDRMRTRAQVDRFITTLILNSLPIALYGFVQHFQRDPLPWGGNVTKRVASNMGNAIFVAAYLIMCVPPTLSRVVDAFRSILHDEETGTADVLRAATYIFIVAVQILAIYYTKSRGPLMGLLLGLGVWGFLGLILLQRNSWQNNPSGDHRRWRWLWVGILLLTVVASALFFSINPGGPLHEWAADDPAIGRLANVLAPDTGTGKVRSLIWQGAFKMILPHAPIQFPPTANNPDWRPDPFNGIRLLIGYGPESMYVAYNSFYPPLLGHYESRTASPDRCHNETLDSVVITGLLGLGIYLWVFISVFYLGLRWLGVLPDGWQRTLFFALLAGGALVFVLYTGLTLGPHFFGLAVPVGIVIGLITYLLVHSFSKSWGNAPFQEKLHPHSLLLMGILATAVAHFVEINFGIGIASTRTTFWALAGVFVLLGQQEIRMREETTQKPRPAVRGRTQKRRRHRSAAPPSRTIPAWLWPTLGATLIGALVLGTLAYDFINNVERLGDPLQIFWRSLTIIAVPARQPARTSWAIMMILGMAWLAAGLLTITQMVKRGSFQGRKGDIWPATLVTLLISLTAGATFGLILAGRHATIATAQVQSIADALHMADYVAGQTGAYYVFLAVIILLGGLALAGERPRSQRWATPAGTLALLAAGLSWLLTLLAQAVGEPGAALQLKGLALSVGIAFGLTAAAGLLAYLLSPSLQERLHALRWEWLGALAAALLLSLVPVLSFRFNLRPIQADIVFKQADPWEKSNQWAVAIQHYQKAKELTPWEREDFYYLYLGRALLEYASTIDDVAQQDVVLRQTEQVLLQAQAINPLNTDHSANLARLYRRWSSLPAGSGEQEFLSQLASDYYDVATTLSPQNVILWNEWATLYHYNLGDDAKYEETLQHAMSLDPEFYQIYLIRADIYAGQGDLEAAIENYRTALELPRYRDQRNDRQIWSALGQAYLQTEQYQEAIDALTKVIELRPNANDIWNSHRLLAWAYAQQGHLDQAVAEAQLALELAPEEQQPIVQQLLQQIEQQIQAPAEGTPP